MRTGPGIWLTGAVASLALNFGAGAGLLAALNPQPVPEQETAQSRMNVTAQEVARSEVQPKDTNGDAVAEQDADPTAVQTGAIAQSTAQPAALPSAKLASTDVATEASAARQPKAPRVTATAAPTTTAAALVPETAPAVARQPAAAELNPEAPRPSQAQPQSPQTAAADPQPLQSASLPRAELQVSRTEPEAPSADAIAPTITQASPAATITPAVAPSAAQAPATQTAAQKQPEVTAGKAVLAFPSDGPVDPVSLAAFQSFTQPQATQNSADLRDGLGAALSLPCARMQVLFDPDTTTLRLTGHVPDAAQRAPVLAALQAQVGNDIAVADNLLVLPAPQCGALSGIAAIGLPQSTDQITNPLIVGADTHARAFRYVDGEPLVMSLTAPDYPAFVYVDYFDANGDVVHLSPNEVTPLRAADAKSVVQIGARNPQEPGLFVTIGPPYGQEIAAAFASSVPLYDETRPLVEPAGPYLAWLKEKVAAARTKHPDFKGEWVYFFVTTAEK